MHSHVERKGMSFPVIWCLPACTFCAHVRRLTAAEVPRRERRGGASYLVTFSAPHAFGATYQWDYSNSERILPSYLHAEQRSGCSPLAQRAPVYHAAVALGTALNMMSMWGRISVNVTPSLTPPSLAFTKKKNSSSQPSRDRGLLTTRLTNGATFISLSLLSISIVVPLTVKIKFARKWSVNRFCRLVLQHRLSFSDSFVIRSPPRYSSTTVHTEFETPNDLFGVNGDCRAASRASTFVMYREYDDGNCPNTHGEMWT